MKHSSRVAITIKKHSIILIITSTFKVIQRLIKATPTLVYFSPSLSLNFTN